MNAYFSYLANTNVVYGGELEFSICTARAPDWMNNGNIGVLTGTTSLAAELTLSANNYGYLNSLNKNGKFLGTHNGTMVEMDNSYLSTKRMRLIRGAEKAKFLKIIDKLKWVKGIGTGFSAIGTLVSLQQLKEAETTAERWEYGIDAVMGGIGFVGLPGALGSLNYGINKFTAPYQREYFIERDRRLRDGDWSMWDYKPGRTYR
jgi:hypothetical protein